MKNHGYVPIALLLAALLSSRIAARQTPAPTPPDKSPDFTVQVWGEVIADFATRVQRYAALRDTAATGLPPLAVTDNPDEITRAEMALARRISLARAPARRGDFFTKPIAGEFRNALRRVTDEKTRMVILDDNPGDFSHRVDIRYPKTRSYSTVPANVLALLPRLPDDIEYRFLGHHLILLDVRANVIVDMMACALECD
jgi:hypothetical protein